VRLTTYHHIVPMSRNLGALTLLDPSGPARPVMGVLYLTYKLKTANETLPPLRILVFRDLRQTFAEPMLSDNSLQQFHSYHASLSSFVSWNWPAHTFFMFPKFSLIKSQNVNRWSWWQNIIGCFLTILKKLKHCLNYPSYSHALNPVLLKALVCNYKYTRILYKFPRSKICMLSFV
jgi:hypothetical protein